MGAGAPRHASGPPKLSSLGAETGAFLAARGHFHASEWAAQTCQSKCKQALKPTPTVPALRAAACQPLLSSADTQRRPPREAGGQGHDEAFQLGVAFTHRVRLANGAELG